MRAEKGIKKKVESRACRDSAERTRAEASSDGPLLIKTPKDRRKTKKNVKWAAFKQRVT